MDNTELVKVLDCQSNLVTKLLDSFLWKLESPLLNVVEEILTSHEFKHNEVVFTVFENVLQFDYIRVLAHFEDLNLPTLLEYLNLLHISLFNDLDGCLSAVALMSG